MYNYEKRLQYPVNIKIKSPKIAQIVLSQYGGPDGESAAAMRYMSQKFAMKNPKVAGLINDIAVEELLCRPHFGRMATVCRRCSFLSYYLPILW